MLSSRIILNCSHQIMISFFAQDTADDRKSDSYVYGKENIRLQQGWNKAK